jgi:4'-phosphopantetheinyl transferase EntD
MELLSDLSWLFGAYAPHLVWRVDPGLSLCHPLVEAEEALITRAVAKRKREFRSGRHLAHAVLELLQADIPALLTSKGGIPSWPEGIVGSITHCDDLAVAVAARKGPFVGFGIDVEPACPLDPSLECIVLSAVDRRVAPSATQVPLWSKTLFCAKEAFYKAVFPITGKVLDFQEAAVHAIDNPCLSRGRFIVAPRAGSPIDNVRCGHPVGRWLRTPSHIFCSCRI